MNYDEMTHESKSLLKSFSHKTRFSIAANNIKTPTAVFDYGTGSAFFLKKLSDKNPDIPLVGYEPVEDMYTLAVSRTADVANIHMVNQLAFSRTYSHVVCLEVLEHLTDEDIKKAIAHFKQLVDPTGIIIISVPIETGLSGLLKNLYRLLLKQQHTHSLKDVFKSFLSFPIKREVIDGYIFSHAGFRFKKIERFLKEEGLFIEKKLCSPFPFLRSILNSQIFFIVKNKTITS